MTASVMVMRSVTESTKGIVGGAICLQSECSEWSGAIKLHPLLILRWPFWCCPKCGVSYGKDAQEAYNPAIQDLEA